MDKKRTKLIEEIQKLQTEMKNSITKKQHGKKELSISEYQTKIKKLQEQYNTMPS